MRLPQTSSSPHPIKLSLIWGLMGVCLIAMLVPQYTVTPGTPVAPVPPGGILPDHPSAFIVCLVGLSIGCYGTIVGIGGGPLILPTMMYFYGWEPEVLVASSLFVVFLNATSGTIGYYRQKRIDYIGGVRLAAAAIPAAVIMGIIHHLFAVPAFDVIFGIFLLLLAVYSLVKVKKLTRPGILVPEMIKPHFRKLDVLDAFGEKYTLWVDDKTGAICCVFMGALVGFLGIGGGVLQVPLLVFVLNYPVHLATATSHFITMIVSFVALIPHLYLGNVFFDETIWMGSGVVVGAQLGAWLAPRIKSSLIIYLFIVIIFVFAAKMLFHL
ncbi:MAG: sulfite exporter TauE/SafE family protein [Planctomycetes bacterium]|nr:sulfite exporter TauE/SafE family protein [Planctomycetota bacterium]